MRLVLKTVVICGILAGVYGGLTWSPSDIGGVSFSGTIVLSTTAGAMVGLLIGGLLRFVHH